jgi:hypothetical protein
MKVQDQSRSEHTPVHPQQNSIDADEEVESLAEGTENTLNRLQSETSGSEKERDNEHSFENEITAALQNSLKGIK